MSLLCVCAAKFWIYWAFTFMTLTFFTMYGMMTVAISPNVQVSCLMHCYLSSACIILSHDGMMKPNRRE